MEVRRILRCDLPFDSSDTVANEYTISIRSTLVTVCSELNGASVRRASAVEVVWRSSRRLEVLRTNFVDAFTLLSLLQGSGKSLC